MVSTWTSSLNCTVFFSVFTAGLREKVANDYTVAQQIESFHFFFSLSKATQQGANMADTHTSFGINKNHFAKQEILGCVQEVEDAFSLFFNCMQLPTNHYYVPNTVIFNPFNIFV